MKFRQHVPVTISADDAAALFNARLKLEKVIHGLILELSRTKGSAALTADFSFRVTEDGVKPSG